MSTVMEEHSATARQKNRYHNARRNPDYTIDQDWQSYSAAEHDRWDRLFKRSSALLQSRACDEYLSALHALELSEAGPNQTDIRYAANVGLTGKLGGLGEPVFRAKSAEVAREFAANLKAAIARIPSKAQI